MRDGDPMVQRYVRGRAIRIVRETVYERDGYMKRILQTGFKCGNGCD